MADRDTRLNIDITAADRASDELRKVAAEVADLEGAHTVTVDADDQASDDLARVDAAADELDGRTATVDVQADIDEAQRLLDQAEASVRALDGRTAAVSVRADVDEASRLLDRISTKLRDLDGRGAAVNVGGFGAGEAAGAVGGGITAGAVLSGAMAQSDFAIQVEQLAKLTGSGREEASRLARVWQDAGLDLMDLLDLMANLQSVIRDTPDLREKLNLSLANDGVTTFLQTVQNLQTEYDTAGDRSKAAAQLFGEEGQRQVQRVLVLVRDDLQGAMDGVAETRLISEQDLENARELNAQATELKNTWQTIQGYALSAAAYINRDDRELNINDIGDVFNAFKPNASGASREADVIARNIGASGAAGFDPYALAGLRPPTGTTAHSPGPVYIYNPPGTPSTTNQQQQQYLSRNGVRLS